MQKAYQAILYKIREYTDDVVIDDSTFSEKMSNLKTTVEETANSINSMVKEALGEEGEGFTLNLNANVDGEGGLNDQIDKIEKARQSLMGEDGKVKVEYEAEYDSLTDAKRALISARQQTEQPWYMTVMVDDEASPQVHQIINLMQQYQLKKWEMEVAIETGASEIEIGALNEEIDGIAQELASLPESYLLEVGLIDEEGGTVESKVEAIKRNLENNTDESPAQWKITNTSGIETSAVVPADQTFTIKGEITNANEINGQIRELTKDRDLKINITYNQRISIRRKNKR